MRRRGRRSVCRYTSARNDEPLTGWQCAAALMTSHAGVSAATGVGGALRSSTRVIRAVRGRSRCAAHFPGVAYGVRGACTRHAAGKAAKRGRPGCFSWSRASERCVDDEARRSW